MIRNHRTAGGSRKSQETWLDEAMQAPHRHATCIFCCRIRMQAGTHSINCLPSASLPSNWGSSWMPPDPRCEPSPVT